MQLVPISSDPRALSASSLQCLVEFAAVPLQEATRHSSEHSSVSRRTVVLAPEPESLGASGRKPSFLPGLPNGGGRLRAAPRRRLVDRARGGTVLKRDTRRQAFPTQHGDDELLSWFKTRLLVNPPRHQCDQFRIGTFAHLAPNLGSPLPELLTVTKGTKCFLGPLLRAMTQEFLPRQISLEARRHPFGRVRFDVQHLEPPAFGRPLLPGKVEPPLQTIRKRADVDAHAKGILEHLIQVVVKLLPGCLHLDERNHMRLADEGDVDSTLLVLVAGVVLKLDSIRIGLIPSEGCQCRQDCLYLRALLVTINACKYSTWHETDELYVG